MNLTDSDKKRLYEIACNCSNNDSESTFIKKYSTTGNWTDHDDSHTIQYLDFHTPVELINLLEEYDVGNDQIRKVITAAAFKRRQQLSQNDCESALPDYVYNF